VTLHELEGYPSAESGGTWAMANPKVLEDLKAYGFNLFARANNHTLDYSYGGLLATNRYLNNYNLIHAGAGENLATASAPKYIETHSGRVALISATSTFHNSWRAGEQRPDIMGRPGVNPLGYQTTYVVTKKEIESLKKIADLTTMNTERNVTIKEGFEIDNSNELTFGPLRFKEGSEFKKETKPLTTDIERLEKSVFEAQQQADIVIVSIHSHEMKEGDKEIHEDFLEIASKKCIDAGADAIVGHGPHVLRGIEIYKNKPIFYSLGNFIFQNETVSVLPADFYDKYNLSYKHGVAEALNKRSKNDTKGLAKNPSVWESVIAMWNMKNKQITSIELYPVELGFGLPRYKRGWPKLTNKEGVLERIKDLSIPFGTEIEIKKGVGTVHL